jgi:GNAT superfamily N-acetyltransferase
MYTYALIPKQEILTIIPLLRILNDQIAEETLTERVNEMVERGYECVGIYDGEKLIGICGLWILTKYYVGRHIEPDNVMILPEYRGQGIGEKLMEWVYGYGRSKGCIATELNCYTANTAGQKFWANEDYRIVGFHYQRKL